MNSKSGLKNSAVIVLWPKKTNIRNGSIYLVLTSVEVLMYTTGAKMSIDSSGYGDCGSVA